MYRVCSVSLIPIELPVCPTYELLQVLVLCIVCVLYVSFLSNCQSVQHMNYCRCCFMYCVCSVCLIPIELPVCPTYDLLRVLFCMYRVCSVCLIPIDCQSVQRMSCCSFVFMYRVCSSCLIPIDMPVCPTYELLLVSDFSSYIPLEFISFWVILSRGCFIC